MTTAARAFSAADPALAADRAFRAADRAADRVFARPIDAAAADRALARLVNADAAFAAAVPDTLAGALAKLRHAARDLDAAATDGGPDASRAAAKLRRAAAKLRRAEPDAMPALRLARAAVAALPASDDAPGLTLYGRATLVQHFDTALRGLSRPRLAAERRE